MPSKKEIGSRLRREILPLIFAPKISIETLEANFQFIAENNEKSVCLLFNRNYEVRFFKFENQYLPTIQLIREHPYIGFPVVKVDQGAVHHILNGADIFAQGIASIDREFNAGSIIMVSNPQNAIIALGKSLNSSVELPTLKGRVILNVHYLGDSIWEGKL
ncbi:MAG: PUA domain-containing protein [Promethearchaeota archaeon]